MTATPWMKFFPSDWRGDPALKACSLAARGLWIEMLAIMHEAQPRGHLVINGREVTAATLAALAGTTPEAVTGLLLELETNGVFSRKKNGVIYSRRMEKDENRSRKARESGKLGGNPTLCKDKGKAGSVKGAVNTHIPEARDQIPESLEQQQPTTPPAPVPAAAAAWDVDRLKIELRSVIGWSHDRPMARVETWLAAGYAPEMILAVVRTIMLRGTRPSSLSYFDAALAQEKAEQGAALSPEQTHERPRNPARGGGSTDILAVATRYLQRIGVEDGKDPGPADQPGEIVDLCAVRRA